MITIYDLLEVKENASKEEIEKSYFNLIEEYKIDPNLTQEQNDDNKIILEKLKLAYNILTNDEKRKRYDADLAKKRAEELIQNVQIIPNSNEDNNNINKDLKENKENFSTKENENLEKSESKVQKYKSKKIKEVVYEEDVEEKSPDAELTEKEKNKIKKEAKKEFEKDLKKAKKAEEEYNKAYNEAYNDYLRKMGFTVEEKWTFERTKRLIIGLFVITCICVFIWMFPPTRALIIQLYEDNFIIKSLVDITLKVIDIIINIFK